MYVSITFVWTCQSSLFDGRQQHSLLFLYKRDQNTTGAGLRTAISFKKKKKVFNQNKSHPPAVTTVLPRKKLRRFRNVKQPKSYLLLTVPGGGEIFWLRNRKKTELLQNSCSASMTSNSLMEWGWMKVQTDRQTNSETEKTDWQKMWKKASGRQSPTEGGCGWEGKTNRSFEKNRQKKENIGEEICCFFRKRERHAILE